MTECNKKYKPASWLCFTQRLLWGKAAGVRADHTEAFLAQYGSGQQRERLLADLRREAKCDITAAWGSVIVPGPYMHRIKTFPRFQRTVGGTTGNPRARSRVTLALGT
jgi:hypothetical protein